MEIKDNKLIIDIPKGMELDTENTDVAKGVIMLRKKKDITYEEIVKLGFYVNLEIGIKAQAIAQLINIAKYYNGDWKPLSVIPIESQSIIFITRIARINME